jgi:UDP-N-acetylglucosamine transferase subunit ALG13
MMVFITAGTQLPFDRLIKAMDEIAAGLPDVKFVAQALNTTYQAKHLTMLDFITSGEFNNYVDECQLIISHAGMGTIFTALTKKKPIIIMPRLVKYKEHRNEHQLGTCKQMDKMEYVPVAYDEVQLKEMFYDMWPNRLKVRNSTVTETASSEFLLSLDSFIKQ